MACLLVIQIEVHAVCLAIDFLIEVVVKIVHAFTVHIGAMDCLTKQIISAFLLCGKMYNICVLLRMVSLLRYSKYMHTHVFFVLHLG